MRYENKALLVRLALSAVVFLLLWAVLTALGARLVDEKAVLEWLSKKEWLSLANPDIRNQILTHWQPLFALLLTAGVFYPLLKNPAASLTKRLFLRVLPLEFRWTPSTPGLPQPEFLYFFPPGFSLVCSPSLQNNTAESIKISRIELETSVTQRFANLGTQVLTGDGAFPLHFESDKPDEQTGLQWKKTAENTWLIDTSFTLPAGGSFELPCPGLDSEEENEKTAAALNRLVGLTTLDTHFNFRLLTETGPLTASLSAPLRVLLSLEQGGDGGIELLISKLTVQTEAEREKLRHAYNQARREDFQIRSAIAQNLNEMLAAQEVEEAEHAVAMHPDDPVQHDNLGHVLLGLGRCQEALTAFDRAAQLGLETPDLHLARGTALLGISQPEKALIEIDTVLASRPGDALAHTQRGRILVNLERDEDALEDYAQAIQIDPGLADAYEGQGLAFIRLDRLEDARISFDHALQLNPDSALAHIGRALALSGLEQDEIMLVEIDKALSLGYRDIGILHLFEITMQEATIPPFRQVLDRYDLLRDYDTSQAAVAAVEDA